MAPDIIDVANRRKDHVSYLAYFLDKIGVATTYAIVGAEQTAGGNRNVTTAEAFRKFLREVPLDMSPSIRSASFFGPFC